MFWYRELEAMDARHGAARTFGQMPMGILLLAGALLAFALVPWIAATTFAFVAAFLLIRWRLARARRRLATEAYLSEVADFGWRDDIDPIEFENRCAEAMRLAGWAAATTKASGDQGVDVTAEREGVRIVLQCKRHGRPVGNKAVQEALSGKLYADADHAAVVTNATFSKSAEDLAERTGVHLLHFTDLARINEIVGLPAIAAARGAGRRKRRAERRVARWRRWRLRVIGLGACALVAAVIHDRDGLPGAGAGGRDASGAAAPTTDGRAASPASGARSRHLRRAERVQ